MDETNVRKPNDHVTPNTGNSIAERLIQAFTWLARAMLTSLNFETLLMRRSKKINKTELIWKEEKRSQDMTIIDVFYTT